MKGEVKWFNREKGFGFVIPEDGKGDAFVHHSEVRGGILMDGESVRFRLEHNDRGRRACDVCVEPKEEVSSGHV